ncbi:MAG: CoA transferase, partial [Dehalococcoidia bacterium]|nr:CoA transferase [Dehalococcoidia bacterium]
MEISNEESAVSFAGKLFARWGSEVVRVESPGRRPAVPAEAIYLHGGKQHFSADYRTAEGRSAIESLAASCDILLTDARVADIESFRLLELGGADSPMVRVAVTPFGLTGPYAYHAATEASLLALAGLTYLTGDPGRAPLTIPGHYAAYQSGTLVYTVALAALIHTRRHPSTPAPTIDVSILESLLGLHQMTEARWLVNGEIRQRVGNRSSASTGAMLRCRDGWFGFSTAGDNWMPFALMLGRPDLVDDERFSTNAGRLRNRDEFDALVQEALSGRTKQEIFHEAQETWRLPMGYGASLAECLADPHLEARGFWRPLAGGAESAAPGIRVPGSPFRFRGEAPPVERGLETPAGDAGSTAWPAPESVRRSPRPQPGGNPRPSTDGNASRPLEGVRVLDLSRVLAGPVCGRFLAAYGADVLRVSGSHLPTFEALDRDT